MGFLPVQKSVYLAIVVMLGVHFLPTPPPLDALRKVGTRTDRVLLGFLMVGAGLSMWIRERVSQGEDPIESTSMRRLIVTADDFGLSPGVNAGIVEAHERGIVTATSLMVNAPAAREALHWASEHRSLAVGLHFVLTFARPVGPTEPLEELVDENGRFRRLETGVRLGTAGHRPMGRVGAERVCFAGLGHTESVPWRVSLSERWTRPAGEALFVAKASGEGEQCGRCPTR